MTDYTGNSIKKREGKEDEKKEIKKVVKGKVSVKKQSELKKIANNIIVEEAKTIKDYAIYDVLIPVVKETITSLIKGSIDMLFYGEVRGSRNSYNGKSGVNASKVSYNSIYDSRRELDYRRRVPDRYSYDDNEFDSKQDAEEVLFRMDEIVEQYGVVTVADFFDLIGVTGNGYTDQNYGWTSTRSASVERTRQGTYFIKLQRPSSIR